MKDSGGGKQPALLFTVLVVVYALFDYFMFRAKAAEDFAVRDVTPPPEVSRPR